MPISVRVRLRDPSGAPRRGESVQILAFPGGSSEPVSSIELQESSDRPGLYSGVFPSLPEARYELAVKIAGVAGEDSSLRLAIDVAAQERVEDLHVSWDETALGALALHGGGRHAREEELGSILAELESLAGTIERVERRDLTAGWPWFLALISLLTLEWILRQRAGLL